MKNKIQDQKERISLLLLFSGIVLILLLTTTVIVGVVVFFLINQGTLKVGEHSIRGVSLFFNLLLWRLLTGAVLVFIASRFPLKPVNKILNALKSLASGDYSVRLSFRGDFSRIPAVREVTDSFNKMASELESTEMLRSDFINNFSHEFKTPIVSIAGFAKLLRKGDLSAQEEAEYLEIIENEALRLSDMATNVLNLSRVENQTILTDVTEYNLSEQLRACVLLLEDKWTKKNLELILDFKEYTITANAELLKEVWLNLLDNAVKFTTDYGLVEIAVSETADTIAVSVINSGKEIPAESLDRIFQKFYQADESHATGGNGIGLAIVQKIVTLHGGHIDVDSRDGRTAFTVTLPKESAGGERAG